MKLNNRPFNLIKDGHKTIEVRLNDDKRKLLQIGDIIEFTNIKTGKNINVRVTNLLHYSTFKELFNSYDPYEFGSNNREDLISSIYKYYSKHQEDEYGVLGIKIKLI